MEPKPGEPPSFNNAGSGLATPFRSPHLTSQGKPSPGTLRVEGREADQETCGTVTKRQTCGEMATRGENYNDWPRTVMTGGCLLVAFAPDGATGNDNDDDDFR